MASRYQWLPRLRGSSGRPKKDELKKDISEMSEVMPILAKFHRGALEILAAHSSAPITTVHEGINLCKSGISHKVRNQVLKVDNAYKLARHITSVFADGLLDDLQRQLEKETFRPVLPPASDTAIDDMRKFFEAKLASLQDQVDMLSRNPSLLPEGSSGYFKDSMVADVSQPAPSGRQLTLQESCERSATRQQREKEQLVEICELMRSMQAGQQAMLDSIRGSVCDSVREGLAEYSAPRPHGQLSEAELCKLPFDRIPS